MTSFKGTKRLIEDDDDVVLIKKLNWTTKK
jgi:hypothetical protein